MLMAKKWGFSNVPPQVRKPYFNFATMKLCQIFKDSKFPPQIVLFFSQAKSQKQVQISSFYAIDILNWKFNPMSQISLIKLLKYSPQYRPKLIRELKLIKEKLAQTLLGCFQLASMAGAQIMYYRDRLFLLMQISRAKSDFVVLARNKKPENSSKTLK